LVVIVILGVNYHMRPCLSILSSCMVLWVLTWDGHELGFREPC